jgi:transposase
MSRKCSICNHPNRTAIDKAIVSGTPIRDIAGQFNVSKSAVYRHKKHIPEALTKAQAAEETAQADNLLDEIRQLQARTTKILGKAEKAGDLPTALKAIREARECLKMLAKLEGILWERKEIEFTANPLAGLTTDELRRLIDEDW